MKATNTKFNQSNSLNRIDSILEGADSQFESLDSIPNRDRLTYNNGFYVQCSALFIDIRGSSKLPEKHRRPVLAKIYRAFLSEVVAAVNSVELCREVNIVGDAVSGIFDVTKKGEADKVITAAARAGSVVDVLNHKMKKRNYESIQVGIGISHGTALMVKAGYSGSGISEVVWMGDVVNEASNLCSHGSRSSNDKRIMVSKAFHERLSTKYQEWFHWNKTRACYHGNVVNTGLSDWLDSQKK